MVIKEKKQLRHISQFWYSGLYKNQKPKTIKNPKKAKNKVKEPFGEVV